MNILWFERILEMYDSHDFCKSEECPDQISEDNEIVFGKFWKRNFGRLLIDKLSSLKQRDLHEILQNKLEKNWKVLLQEHLMIKDLLNIFIV